jgi:hypothetical protein
MPSKGRVAFEYALNRNAANRIARYLKRHGFKNVEVSRLKTTYRGKPVYAITGQKFRGLRKARRR